MALRPNTSPFTPGAQGVPSSQSPSAALSKQSSFISSAPPSPAPISGLGQSIPNKSPSRPQPKTKALPRGNQGKRGQTQRKFEKKGRLAGEAITVDPVLESVVSAVVLSLTYT